MDATRFDSLSKLAGKSSSRRQAIKLFGGAVGALAPATGLGVAGAKQNGKNKKQKGKRRHAGEGAVSAQLMMSGGDLPTGDVPTTGEPRPQNDFVRGCRANGGTSTRVGTYKVKCCYPPSPGCTVSPCTGWCDTCDFHDDPPSCKETMLLSNGVEIDVDVTPGPAFPAP